jgi:hypothetical protein
MADDVIYRSRQRHDELATIASVTKFRDERDTRSPHGGSL